MYTTTLNEQYPNVTIRPPEETFLSRALAPLDGFIEAVSEETDPEAIVRRMRAESEIELTTTLQNMGRPELYTALRLGERLADSGVGDVILAPYFGPILEGLHDVISGRSTPTAETIEDMSAREVEGFVKLWSAELSDINNVQGDLTYAQAERFLNRHSGGLLAIRRLGSRFAPEHYSLMFQGGLQRAYETVGEDFAESVTNTVFSDMTADLNDLQEMVRSNNGSLTVTNGQITILPSSPNNPFPLPVTQTLERVNGKLQPYFCQH